MYFAIFINKEYSISTREYIDVSFKSLDRESTTLVD